MKLNQIFVKPINRTIEGVIKADDLASLKLEVEEYVITNEVAKSLERFFSAYNDFQGANGVWISGFFGSGKSHLLKMMALLLENRKVDGKTTLEYFLPKCQDNAMLKADMKRAAETPSKSILFNIDQKADTISKAEVDAVLAVFVKVFNEMCGYYGKQGYVAQFERDLDKRGKYQEFKKAYKEIAGKDWETGREEVILEKGNVAKAYAQISGTQEEANKNIIDAYREDYKLSIEDFAGQVSDFIRKQEPGFRLNFFVDEVGQYVADNVKLMTNLQTIAESLATKCNGQSWIIVTAQEEMEKVLGEMNRQQTTDFSKIQDRFKTRMKLTSQNVADVIQERLLKKNEQGVTLAEKLYGQEKNNFGTLFDFTDGATLYRNFGDEKHFINSYPFIPYQYSLFQTSIETLSAHSAFEGKHSSVGERSMLGVFQEVAIKIADKDVGQLASFDTMFEGIRAALKSKIQSSVLLAENQLENKFAIRVLKALFLVKYIKGFNATPRNLRVLLQDDFRQDVTALKKNIEVALNLLEQQTYIQRNGEVYEYLTDDEKDVEEEIKNTVVDSGEVAKSLEEILFDGIIKDRKIRYDVTAQDYSFTKKLDDKIIGREFELAIHFVTPFSENVDNLQLLKANSLGRPELMVVLPADARMVQDLLHYKRSEKYIRINRSTTQQESILMILNNKGFQNTERFKLIQDHTRELIGRAKFFVAGEPIEVSGEDPRTRIVKGFNELIVRTYPNLRMLKGTAYNENDIKKYLEITKNTLISDNPTEAELEVLAFVQSNKRIGTRSTMKSIEETFSKKPYGWYLAAIQCVVAMLAGRGKIEARSDANILEDATLERALKNTHGFGNIILDPQADYTPSELRRLKDFYSNFFDRPPSMSEAKDLGNETRDAFRDMNIELKNLAVQSSLYPFLSVLNEPIIGISELLGKDYSFYLRELPSKEDVLLDIKEKILDPVRQFLSGTNKTIYDEARRFLQEQGPNFSSIGNGKPDQLRAILSNQDCFKGTQMKEAKSLMDGLRKDVEQHLKAEKERALGSVSYLRSQMQAMEDYAKLSQEQKQEIDQSFQAIEYKIKEHNLVAVIRDEVGRYETGEYNRLLTKISGWVNVEGEPVPEFISQKELEIKFGRPYLENEEDVNNYLEALRKAMLKAIKANKRIRY
jgi:energy-coupling factor transporter ATP-binding protein EcfA2